MQRCSLYCVHKLISIYVHCDLDLWPLTSKINRVHPLVMVNMSAKFDKEICNGVVSIVFTRSTHGRNHGRKDWLTDGTTAALLYPHRNALRGDNKEWVIWSRSQFYHIYTIWMIFRRQFLSFELSKTTDWIDEHVGSKNSRSCVCLFVTKDGSPCL